MEIKYHCRDFSLVFSTNKEQILLKGKQIHTYLYFIHSLKSQTKLLELTKIEREREGVLRERENANIEGHLN